MHPDGDHDSDLDPIDLRLVVCDMDGTLLDGDKELPGDLPDLLRRLAEHDVVFCPASGRQHATLQRMFPDLPGEAVLIAENGAYVTAGGEEVSVSPLPRDAVQRIVAAVHEMAQGSEPVDLGVIVCGTGTAYVERTDPGFRVHVDPHYAEVTEVPSLDALLREGAEDDLVVVKVAIFAAEGPQPALTSALADAAPGAQVVVSGPQYVDVMAQGVHKGVAVASLRERLGLARHQVAVFGDAPNDTEMLGEADWSFAVANAHDEVAEQASYRAPSNTEGGVQRTLHRLLDGERPDSPAW